MFLTAASRRSLDSVSVPMVGVRLSPPLNVVALVVHYTTNKLILSRLLQKRKQINLLLYPVGTIKYCAPFPENILNFWVDSYLLLPRLPWFPNKFGPLDLHALSTPPAFILS